FDVLRWTARVILRAGLDDAPNPEGNRVTTTAESSTALVTIRLASVEDAESIAAYHHRCWVIGFSSLLEPGVVDRMNPLGKLDRWRRWLAPGSGFVTMTADDSGTPIGHTTVSGHELVHLFVDPDHWGRGLGRRLLEVGEDVLRSAGHRDIELSTMVGN